jgi:hypothetical protein
MLVTILLLFFLSENVFISSFFLRK